MQHIPMESFVLGTLKCSTKNRTDSVCIDIRRTGIDQKSGRNHYIHYHYDPPKEKLTKPVGTSPVYVLMDF